MTKKPENRASIDWEAVEREYRAGQLSVKEIARQQGCTDAGIAKRAKRCGWTRDLTTKVQQEVKAKVARYDARGPQEGRGLGGSVPSLPPPRAEFAQTAEAQTIEAASDRGMAVVMGQRTFLGRMKSLAERMLDELEATTSAHGELATMIEEATKDDKTPQRYNAMMKAIEVPGRIAALKDLSMVAKNLVPLERQAYNLDEVKDTEAGLGALIEASFRRLPEPDPTEGVASNPA